MDAMRCIGSRAWALVALAVLVGGCGGEATGPALPDDRSAPSLLQGVPSAGTTVSVLERTVPLDEEERVSRTIGLFGGVIVLPRAGLTVLVPPGAVLTPTRITVVAPAGDLVGYELLPAGQRFAVPLVLRQSLLLTEAWPPVLSSGGPLVAAYFEGPLAATVDALELLGLDLLGSAGIFQVEHFSGYVIGTN